MLSRTAENLFWMGRYMERAENTARMLDVNYQTSLLPQSASAAEAVASRITSNSSNPIFRVIILSPSQTMADPVGVVLQTVHRPGRPGSLVGVINRVLGATW